MRIIWQTVRRITNQILGVEGLKEVKITVIKRKQFRNFDRE